MKNIFCIDLEDWYHQSLIPSDNTDFSPRVERNTDRLLALFDQTGTKATFFTLGQIARRHPALIRRVQAAGHEIACHGDAHRVITGQTQAEFYQDVKQAKETLEDICGTAVKGYRAPSWTITRKTLWALQTLWELGFVYDSSIFPVQNFLYGIPDAPRFAYQRTVNGGTLWEVPPSTMSVLGKNMGFSGGFYLRALPKPIIKWAAHTINKQRQPAVFYLHPVEIDRDCPRMRVPLRDRIILYWGLHSCEKKLLDILKAYDFVSIAQFYDF